MQLNRPFYWGSLTLPPFIYMQFYTGCIYIAKATDGRERIYTGCIYIAKATDGRERITTSLPFYGLAFEKGATGV
jgi:hypothetical protein